MLKLKKSLGQNLLVDKNVINKIVNLEVLANQKILEIGPGSGNLTDFINIKKPKSLFLIEKDFRFYNILNKKYGKLKNCNIINEDILSFDLNKFKDKDVIIYGNLPYNISTQILAKFIKIKIWPPFYKKIIFMFQDEVANRILAKTNTSNFGRLTVLSNFRLEIEDTFKISKECFFPVPKVDSRIVVFKPKNKINIVIKNLDNLEKITQIFFSNRRKMINKTFARLFKNHQEIAKKLKINLLSRPAEISCQKYYEIVELYEKNLKS